MGSGVGEIQEEGRRGMEKLKGTRTHENLKKAFANEAQAYRRYLYFARLADVDSFPEIGGLFRDTAEGEASYAQGHA